MLSQSLLSLSLLIHLLFLSSSLFLVLPLVQVSSSATGSFWTTGTPMPTARSEITGAALNNKIYIVGGFDETGRSSTIVEVYDPRTDEWITSSTSTTTAANSAVAPLPQPLDHAAAASYINY
jgi:hypothetical protein